MNSHPLARILRRGGLVVGLAAMLVVAAGGAGIAAAMPEPGSGLHTVLTPDRVLDTRSGVGAPQAPLGPNAQLDVEVTSVPKGTTAVVVNFTVVNGTSGSFLTVWAKGDPQPSTSTINWLGSSAVANGATVAVHDDHHLTVLNSTGSVDVIIDLVGYYSPGVGATGPAGPAGPPGATGDVGPAGAVGAAGDAGPAGAAGAAGAVGAAGLPGAVGPAGEIGPTGPVGPAGPIGAAGAAGAAGLPGAVGPAGDIGPAGPIGETGADGTNGATGPAGPAGPVGAVGAAGPAGKDGTSAGPAGSVYLQAFNSTAETIHRAGSGNVLTFDTLGLRAGGITFDVGTGSFVVANAGVYKVTFSITAAQLNQFDIRVNGAAPDGGAIVFGGTANQPNAGTAILTLSAGDIVTLENLTSTGFVPPPALNALGAPALLEGDVTLAAQTGGTASSVNASIVIEQLNAPLARE